MTDLYRLVSPEKLELYDLKKDGKLVFCQSIEAANFNFKKIRHLILSAYFVNWDMTRIENTAYQPRGDANLFASKSLFEKENLIITAPYLNISTGFWAQAWAPKDKLVSILKNIPKRAKIYAESIAISANDNTTFWQSGPITLNNSDETGFAARHSATIHGKVVATLNGFNFMPRAAFNLFKQKKPYALILAGLALFASIIFAWEYSIKDALRNNREPAAIFDNRLLGLELINTIQNFVPNGAAERMTFDQRTKEMHLTFVSKTKATKFFEIVLTSPESTGDWDISITDYTIIFKERGGDQ
jgi:hypothetical protein